MSGGRSWMLAHGIDPRLYEAWVEMRRRCRDPKHISYPNYGGRGIQVHSWWKTFTNFAADMGPHPGKGWSLERRHSDQDYQKNNCCWANATQQTRNRRFTKLTADQAAEIRRRYTPGSRWQPTTAHQLALAKEFGVSKASISLIVRKESWVNVPQCC